MICFLYSIFCLLSRKLRKKKKHDPMEQGNHSRVKEFIFQGLTQSRELSRVLFLLLSLVYTTTVLGNLLIMVTVSCESRLQTPMYFLLRNLSVLDICFSSTTAPKVLVDLLSERKTISFRGCLTQMFFFHLLGGAETKPQAPPLIACRSTSLLRSPV